MQLKAILSKDLPPYGFWQWVCSGLNVLDALLVVCWLGLTLTWTWAKSAGRIPRINGGIPQNLSFGLSWQITELCALIALKLQHMCKSNPILSTALTDFEMYLLHSKGPDSSFVTFDMAAL